MLLALQREEGAGSQGLWAASRSWERHGGGHPHSLHKATQPADTVISPDILVPKAELLPWISSVWRCWGWASWRHWHRKTVLGKEELVRTSVSLCAQGPSEVSAGRSGQWLLGTPSCWLVHVAQGSW